MTKLERLQALEREWHKAPPSGNRAYARDRFYDAVRDVAPDLIRVALAAKLRAEFAGEHYWRCEFRAVARGWKPGGPPIIECICGLEALDVALARSQQQTS